jgi:transposase-like protein
MTPKTAEIQTPTKARRHVRHSLEFKRQVVAACNRPGTTTAAVARAHGINANMLRRWVALSSQCARSELTQAVPPSVATHFDHGVQAAGLEVWELLQGLKNERQEGVKP